MKSYLLPVAFLLLLSCHSAAPSVPIQGTWRLLSGTTITKGGTARKGDTATKGDTAFTDYTRGTSMIKIINASHFAFLKHDLNKASPSPLPSALSMTR